MTRSRRDFSLAAALVFGLSTGLWGIRWGLPGAQRLRAFPDRLRPTPQVAREFARRWELLYRDLKRSHEEMAAEEPVTYVKGVDDIAPGWAFPPDKLLNSYRSLLLQSENADEKKSFIILSQMRPWKFDFKPLYVVYPGFYIYPLGVFLKALSIAGALTLVPDMSHYLQNPDDMGRLYLAGRAFILLFQLGSLWALYDMGRRLSGPFAGFCAALFFALCPLVAVNSHVLKPHPYAAFWALAALRASLLAFDGGRARDYRLCGLLAGAAFGANYTLAFLAGLPLLAWLGRRRLAAVKRGELQEALAGAAIAAALFIASNPYFVFAHGNYAWEMRYARRTPGLELSSAVSVFRELARSGMGIVLCGLSVFGAAWGAANRAKAWRFLTLGFIASGGVLWVMLSLFAGGFVAFPRYYYPLVGWACLLAAGAVAALPGKLRYLVLVAAVADAGLGSWVCLENMRLDSGTSSTRALAADWIDGRIPPGASVGLLRYPDPAHAPPFHFDRYRLIVFDSARSLEQGGLYPDYLVYDSDAAGELDAVALKRYERVAQFLPYEALGRRMGAGDDSAINPAFYVYRQKAEAS